ncbi:hypothetical protein [Bradyrhizobium sp. 138]|uniref:hypothetical protein n=1 Tax=Bradyrhizobium sp. 138 TaxID=2782615 RepID=UPI001FF9A572|nr:hypothetical protein [Bradyrhizobium sp. 138]
MTLRTAVATLMRLAPRERFEAAIFRVCDSQRLAQSEIAELASHWGIEPTPKVDRRDWSRNSTGRMSCATWFERRRCRR